MSYINYKTTWKPFIVVVAPQCKIDGIGFAVRELISARDYACFWGTDTDKE